MMALSVSFAVRRESEYATRFTYISAPKRRKRLFVCRLKRVRELLSPDGPLLELFSSAYIYFPRFRLFLRTNMRHRLQHVFTSTARAIVLRNVGYKRL